MDNVCSGGEGFCGGGGSGVMCSNDLLTRQEDPQLGLLGGIFLLERLVLAISPPPFLFCHPNGTVPGVGNLNCEEGCWWVVLRPSLHLCGYGLRLHCTPLLAQQDKKIWFQLFPCLPLLPSLRAPLNFSYLQQKCSLPLQVFHHVQKKQSFLLLPRNKKQFNISNLLSTRTCDQAPLFLAVFGILFQFGQITKFQGSEKHSDSG
jgi:hypothetical protein